MDKRPNVVMIMCDDHAYQCISAYADTVVKTPNIDRIAEEGARLDDCCCTNSICSPSRANILSGLYSHKNGVMFLADHFDNSQRTFAHVFREQGYQTGIFGKWHLGTAEENTPRGFDKWEVLSGTFGQGEYFNPEFQSEDGIKIEKGYATDIISEKSLQFIRERDKNKPFMLLSWHKAPHRPWIPDHKYKDIYKDVHFPEPETFDDDYSQRSPAAEAAWMRMTDMKPYDYKVEKPDFATEAEEKSWIYQRYMQDYWACLKSLDDAVKAMLDCLDEEGIADNTIVIYTSDQGFYTGEHGWFDKRFIYEESVRMPFLIRFPGRIKAGSVIKEQIANIDFGSTLLDLCGIDPGLFPCDGRSFADVLTEGAPGRDYVYYHYFDYPSEHNVYPHIGLRSKRYTLACFWLPDEDGKIKEGPWWELFDREEDPHQLKSLAEDEAYRDVLQTLQQALRGLVQESGDPLPDGVMEEGKFE